MTEFGLALVVGGLVFADMMIPVVAYLLNFGFMQKRPEPNRNCPAYRAQIARFRSCFIRDMIFQLVSLTLLYFALERGTVTMFQVSLQLILFAIYVMTIYCMDKNQRAEEKILRELEEEREVVEGQALGVDN